MNIFARRRTPAGQGQVVAYEQIRDRLDIALTSIFTEDGKRTVLYYLGKKYSLTLDEASKKPGKLEASLTNLLGEVGWAVVKRRILQEFYGPSIEFRGVSVKRASLKDAFGLLRSIGVGQRSSLSMG